jgi:hypothetical protein
MGGRPVGPIDENALEKWSCAAIREDGMSLRAAIRRGAHSIRAAVCR